MMQHTARTRWMISGTTSTIIVCISFVRRLWLPIRHICCFIGDVWHRRIVPCHYNSGSHLSAVHLTATRHPTVSFKILTSFCTISLVIHIFLYLDKMYSACYVIKRNFVSLTSVKPRPLNKWYSTWLMQFLPAKENLAVQIELCYFKPALERVFVDWLEQCLVCCSWWWLSGWKNRQTE